MQLTVSGHHIGITEGMRTHVTEKFEKLQRHIDNITKVEVTLIVEKQGHKAEASLHVAGADLFAIAESDDMYTAIDALADKLDRQIIKHQETHRGH